MKPAVVKAFCKTQPQASQAYIIPNYELAVKPQLQQYQRHAVPELTG